jgi:cation diffusion facilitator family transporter
VDQYDEHFLKTEDLPGLPALPAGDPDKLLSKRSEEDKQIERIALGACFVSILLAGLKGGLALLSGSLAVTADALDSAMDSVASLMVWIGLKLSRRKSRHFPYGLYKVENFISIAVALCIFYAGIEIALQALGSASNRPVVTWPIIGGILVSAATAFLFGGYARRVGKRAESPALMAEGRHRQMDAASSVVVFCALVANYFGFHVDQIAAIVVLIFILRTGCELFYGGMRVLLDASLDVKTMDQIEKIIKSHPFVAEVRFLVGRNAGRYRFVETILILKTGDLTKAHQASLQIEEAIRKQVRHVERVLIHYEPTMPTHLYVAAPLEDLNGKLCEHFGEAPYFIFVRLKQDTGCIESQEILANPFASIPRGKGLRVAEWLIQYKTGLVLVREPLRGKGPGYALGSAGVEVQLCDVDIFHVALERLRHQQARFPLATVPK